MSSSIDICNLALSHIGDEASVVAIDPPEDSEQARQCARFYPMARDAVLEAHDWRCITRRAALALVDLGDDQPPSWSYAYSLPTGCIKPLSVLFPESTNDDDTQPFIVESRSTGEHVLYTNVETAWLRFTVRVTDTTKYMPTMVMAIARLLASMLAGPIIKGSEGMRVSAGQLKIYTDIELPAATAADSVSKQTDTYNTFTPAGLAARL